MNKIVFSAVNRKKISKMLTNKLIPLFLIFLFSMLNAVGQAYKNGDEAKIITGRVTSYDPNAAVEIGLFYDYLAIGRRDCMIRPNSDGAFTVEVDADASSDLTVRFNERIFNIFVANGDSVHIELEREQTMKLSEAIHFSGDNAKRNNDLLIYKEFASDLLSKTYAEKELAVQAMEPVPYKSYRDSLYNLKKDQLAIFIKANDIEASLREWIALDIEADYITDMFWYPSDHMTANNFNIFTDWALPADYYGFLAKYDQLDRHHLTNASFVNALTQAYPRYIYSKMILTRRDDVDDSWNLLRSTGGIVSSGNTDSLLIGGYLKHCKNALLMELILANHFVKVGRLDKGSVETYQKYEDLIDKEIKNVFLIRPLKALYQENLNTLERIKAKASFEGVVDISELTSGQEILNHIYTKNIGKVVYVDIWATWCGPCLQEMPNAVKLHNEFLDEPVEFVYISVDSDKLLALAAIEKYGLKGTHYILNADQSKNLRQTLALEGIPFYLLYDTAGEIVMKVNTFKPSKMKSEIEKLLKRPLIHNFNTSSRQRDSREAVEDASKALITAN